MMKINIRTIRYTLIIAFIALELTIISCALKCIYYDFPFYDFLLTIFGGIFASMLVVLACEIDKYLINKRQNEDQLFYHMTVAYSNILVMKNTLENIINKPKEEVFNNMLTQSRDQIQLALYYLSNIDYTTYTKTELYLTLQKFYNEIKEIQKDLNNSRYLDIAINEDKIKKIQETHNPTCTIAGDSPTVLETAKILIKRYKKVIEKFEKLLSIIDYSDRYNWKDKKILIDEDCDIFCEDFTIEKFLRCNDETNIISK